MVWLTLVPELVTRRCPLPHQHMQVLLHCSNAKQHPASCWAVNRYELLWAAFAAVLVSISTLEPFFTSLPPSTLCSRARHACSYTFQYTFTLHSSLVEYRGSRKRSRLLNAPSCVSLRPNPRLLKQHGKPALRLHLRAHNPHRNF